MSSPLLYTLGIATVGFVTSVALAVMHEPPRPRTPTPPHRAVAGAASLASERRPVRPRRAVESALPTATKGARRAARIPAHAPNTP